MLLRGETFKSLWFDDVSVSHASIGKISLIQALQIQSYPESNDIADASKRDMP